MKTRIFTSMLLIAVSLCGFAQDKASLKQATELMITLRERNDYKALADAAYPKIFKTISKEEYAKQLEKNMSGSDYTGHIEKVDPSIDYGAINRTDKGLYCIINYNTSVRLMLKNKVAKKDQPELINRFKKILNSKDVYYTEVGNTIQSKNRIQTVAIFDDSTRGRWTFVDPTSPYAKDVLNQNIKNELDPNYVAPIDPKVQAARAKAGDVQQTELQKEAAKKEALNKKLSGTKKS